MAMKPELLLCKPKIDLPYSICFLPDLPITEVFMVTISKPSEIAALKMLHHKDDYLKNNIIASLSYVTLMKQRFVEAEPTFAKDPLVSYAYAETILKGRFELGEDAIATSSFFSYKYAVNVIKEPFEKGHNVIYADDSLREDYQIFCKIHKFIKIFK